MKIRLDLKIFALAILFYFTRQIHIYSLLMLFALLHELGHMIAGIFLGFKPSSISIMPVGMSIELNVNTYEYNKKIKKGNRLNVKKMLIALVGPFTNLVIAVVTLLIQVKYNLNYEDVIYANLLLAIFNLISIYPLDGGRIIKNILTIFLGKYKAIKYTNVISNATIIVLTMFSSIMVLKYENVFILLILTYLWYLVLAQNKRCDIQLKMLETISSVKKEERVKCEI